MVAMSVGHVPSGDPYLLSILSTRDLTEHLHKVVTLTFGELIISSAVDQHQRIIGKLYDIKHSVVPVAVLVEVASVAHSHSVLINDGLLSRLLLVDVAEVLK